MAHKHGKILDAGDLFSDMKISTVGGDGSTFRKVFTRNGRSFSCTGDTGNSSAVSSYSTSKNRVMNFKEGGNRLMTLSEDARERARATVEKPRISFPVDYVLNTREVSAKRGAFYDEKDGFLHATGLIITPERKVADGVYSTLTIV